MRFLCYFMHRHLDYRRAEVEALAQLAGCHVGQEDEGPDNERPPRGLKWWLPPGGQHPDSPFHYVDLPSEKEARFIAGRSMLLKGIYEVWGDGATIDEVEAAVKAFPEEQKAPYLAADTSFKIVVDRFGHVLSMTEQRAKIEQLAFIPFEGNVDLKNAAHHFWLIESVSEGNNNGLPPALSPWMCFARLVATSDRTVLAKYELSRRSYLGPTAMDPEVALIMANQALATKGSLVFDPFTGTGSILVAAAHFGATTVGADIDIRVVRDGKGPDCNVWSNFRQYGLTTPVGLIRGDNNQPPWRKDLREVFDAIICDPPYGVRAGGRKSGGRRLLNGQVEAYVIPDNLRSNHIPSTAAYTLAECLFDLLETAARLLVLRGRLVFFFPATAQDEATNEMALPRHPCLRMVANTEQILTKRWSRRLLTMEKIRPYTEEMARDAATVHEDFRVNHTRLVEEGKHALRELVFSPIDSPADIHKKASFVGSHLGEKPQRKKGGFSEDDAPQRPKYRAKCV
eukprot:TRINITY_DN23399_c0_g1_i1.p1 TRINITY_DN23399_c0_g1~~TRINITY_DN23399_c0_g1_i1.p1  ORF type:complete len:512 (+),score=78.13 TRINITY_DN23399_c0_g1_i1:226-1761(+)